MLNQVLEALFEVLVPAMVRAGSPKAALDLLVVVQHPPAVVRALAPVAKYLAGEPLATVLAQVQHFAAEYDEAKAEGLAAIVSGPGRALLAFDFDGVLSPIVDDPEKARILLEDNKFPFNSASSMADIN